MSLVGKHILVTGGLGYIGAHTAMVLLEQGYQVTILDMDVYGRPNDVPGARVIKGDIADAETLNVFDVTYDALLHFASYIEVGESVREPEKYFTNNTEKTYGLLELAGKHGVGCFILSSTAAVYGEPQFTPITEAHPIAPVNPYGESKANVEKAMPEYEATSGMKCGALRYFNASGCRPDGAVGEWHKPETHLIPLVMQAASGRRENISIFGSDYDTPDGSCVRDYVHVLDLADAHVKFMEYLWNGGDERAFNLGTGNGYSVKQVIDAAEAASGKTITRVEAERREGDPSVLVADGGKAQSVLGWKPQHSDLATIAGHAWMWEQKLVDVDS